MDTMSLVVSSDSQLSRMSEPMVASSISPRLIISGPLTLASAL